MRFKFGYSSFGECVKAEIHTTPLKEDLLLYFYYKDTNFGITTKKLELIKENILEELLAFYLKESDEIYHIIDFVYDFYFKDNDTSTQTYCFYYFRDFKLTFERNSNSDNIRIICTDGTSQELNFLSLDWLLRSLANCNETELLSFLDECMNR